MEHVEHYAWVGSSHQTDPSVSISPTLFFHQHKPSFRLERLLCISALFFIFTREYRIELEVLYIRVIYLAEINPSGTWNITLDKHIFYKHS